MSEDKHERRRKKAVGTLASIHCGERGVVAVEGADLDAMMPYSRRGRNRRTSGVETEGQRVKAPLVVIETRKTPTSPGQLARVLAFVDIPFRHLLVPVGPEDPSNPHENPARMAVSAVADLA